MSMSAYEKALQQNAADLANADDENYTRRRVVFESLPPDVLKTDKVLTFGNGIKVNRTERLTDDAIINKLIVSNGEASYFEQQVRDYKVLEDIFNEEVGFNADTGEGSHGFRQALDNFFASWSGLQSQPDSNGAKQHVRQQTSLLIDAMKARYELLQQNSVDLKIKIDETREKINSLGSEVATLTREIQRNAISGTSINDLLDARESAVNELSKLVDCNVIHTKDFGLVIRAGEFNLVMNGFNNNLPEEYNYDDPNKIYFDDRGAKYHVKRGEITSYIRSLHRTESIITELDSFANALRETVNVMHNAGRDVDGDLNTNFFATVADVGADGVKGLFLAKNIQEDALNIAKGISEGWGDGTMARAINHLRTGKIDFSRYRPIPLGGRVDAAEEEGDGNVAEDAGDVVRTSKRERTMLEFVIGLEDEVSKASERVQNSFKHEDTVRNQIKEQKLSISGVNRRESEMEIVKMVNSASKLIAAIRRIDMLEQEIVRIFS